MTVFQKLQNSYHLNVTGIKALDSLDKTITWLTNTYCNKIDLQVTSRRIDNITSAFDLKRFLRYTNWQV